MRVSWKKILSLALFPAFIAAMAVLGLAFGKELTRLVASRELFRSWVAGLGPMAVPAYVALQFIQVVVFVIPGELAQIAGGFAFGTLMGGLWSVVGIGLGSAFNFYVARFLGRPFVSSLAGAAALGRFEKAAASPRSRTAFFLFFLIPGMPKDVLCYAAGLSPLGFLEFLCISMLARAPGILGSALMGDAAADGRWMTLIAVGGGALALFLAGFLFRERIHLWVERIAARRSGKDL